MGGRGIIVRWMSPEPGRSRVYSTPCAAVLTAGMLLVFSWLSLGFGAYFVTRLYHDNLWLGVENARLHEQTAQLGEMRALVKSIETDGKVIRGFLGVEKRREGGGGKGQGGFTADDHLPQLALDEAPRIRTETGTENHLSSSLLDQTRRVKENLRELLQVMREQRNRLDHTPSIVPVDSQTYCFSSGFGWRQSPLPVRGSFIPVSTSAIPRERPLLPRRTAWCWRRGHPGIWEDISNLTMGEGARHHTPISPDSP
jgi:hypothetical protein